MKTELNGIPLRQTIHSIKSMCLKLSLHTIRNTNHFFFSELCLSLSLSLDRCKSKHYAVSRFEMQSMKLMKQ